VIFVMDRSGSQSGFPIAKSVELTHKLIHNLRPGDTFNVMTFSTDNVWLWPSAHANSPENVAAADKFISPMTADGGTDLRKAVVACLDAPDDPNRIRLVVFNTDGFVGDEKQILDSVQKHHRNSRVFTFGIGNSVNRFLIDAMSAEGGGDSETVTLAENSDPAVARFLERTQTPVLTNIEAHVDGVPVSDMLPGTIPDVFSGKPVVLYGRYAGSGPAKVVVTGKLGGKPWSQTLNVNFPSHADAPALMGLWARRRVDDLTRENWLGTVSGDGQATKVDDITDLALEFGIMTEYTSFVAVEPRVVNIGGKSRTVRVPIEMADGVSFTAVDGIAPKPVLMMGLASTQGTTRNIAPARGGMGGGLGGGLRSTTGGGPSRTVPNGLTIKSADPTSNSLLVESPEQRRKINTEQKIEKHLRTAKGQVEIQVFLNAVSDDVLKKIRELGVTIDVADKKLRMLFGTCDAKVLEKLAQIEAVDRVEPLGS
jgi:Ca-activated chloride channel family protein